MLDRLIDWLIDCSDDWLEYNRFACSRDVQWFSYNYFVFSSSKQTCSHALVIFIYRYISIHLYRLSAFHKMSSVWDARWPAPFPLYSAKTGSVFAVKAVQDGENLSSRHAQQECQHQHQGKPSGRRVCRHPKHFRHRGFCRGPGHLTQGPRYDWIFGRRNSSRGTHCRRAMQRHAHTHSLFGTVRTNVRSIDWLVD